MALGHEAWREARRTLKKLLSDNESTLRDDVSLRNRSVWTESAVAHLGPDLSTFQIRSAKLCAAPQQWVFLSVEGDLLLRLEYLLIFFICH